METLKQSQSLRTKTWTPFLCHIRGVVPLLMSNPRTVDVLDEYSLKRKEITKKHHTKITEKDQLTLRRLDWESRLYLDKNGSPIVPSSVLYGSIISGSSAKKKFSKGFDVMDDAILEYDGPRDIENLYNDPNFVDFRKVGVNKSSIMRCRPVFPEWSLQFTAMYNENIIDRKDIEKAIMQAGEECGIGDYRPRFGRFEVLSFDYLEN